MKKFEEGLSGKEEAYTIARSCLSRTAESPQAVVILSETKLSMDDPSDVRIKEAVCDLLEQCSHGHGGPLVQYLAFPSTYSAIAEFVDNDPWDVKCVGSKWIDADTKKKIRIDKERVAYRHFMRSSDSAKTKQTLRVTPVGSKPNDLIVHLAFIGLRLCPVLKRLLSFLYKRSSTEGSLIDFLQKVVATVDGVIALAIGILLLLLWPGIITFISFVLSVVYSVLTLSKSLSFVGDLELLDERSKIIVVVPDQEPSPRIVRFVNRLSSIDRYRDRLIYIGPIEDHEGKNALKRTENFATIESESKWSILCCSQLIREVAGILWEPVSLQCDPCAVLPLPFKDLETEDPFVSCVLDQSEYLESKTVALSYLTAAKWSWCKIGFYGKRNDPLCILGNSVVIYETFKAYNIPDEQGKNLESRLELDVDPESGVFDSPLRIRLYTVYLEPGTWQHIHENLRGLDRQGKAKFINGICRKIEFVSDYLSQLAREQLECENEQEKLLVDDREPIKVLVRGGGS